MQKTDVRKLMAVIIFCLGSTYGVGAKSVIQNQNSNTSKDAAIMRNNSTSPNGNNKLDPQPIVKTGNFPVAGKQLQSSGIDGSRSHDPLREERRQGNSVLKTDPLPTFPLTVTPSPISEDEKGSLRASSAQQAAENAVTNPVSQAGSVDSNSASQSAGSEPVK
jgi:hypothetical protein